MRISGLLVAWSVNVSLCAATLIPGTQLPITMDGSVFSPVDVAGNSSGFISVWHDTSGNIQSSFFAAGGNSWAAPVEIAGNASYLATVTANALGFVSAWVNVPPGGFPPGNVYAAFSGDNGSTWSLNQISEAGGEAWYPIGLAANNTGFMAVWIEFDFDSSTEDVWVSFSSDGVTWNAPVEAYLGGGLAGNVEGNTFCGIAATSDGFMISWISGTGASFSSFSNDSGATWSAPSNITMSLLNDGFGAQLAGTDAGFMAVWQDTSNTLQSSFSTNQGATWNTPVPVSTSVHNADILLSASSVGFVIGWHDSDNNVEGAISTDNGATWNSVLITDDGSVNSDTYDSFVGVNATSTGAMFTWIDNLSNGQSNFATFSSIAPNPPTGLSGSQKKNNFVTLFELYNTLKWNLSSSDSVSAYYVFRNGERIATLGANATSYQDHNQKKGSAVTYTVTAVDGNGNQSLPATITIY